MLLVEVPSDPAKWDRRPNVRRGFRLSGTATR
jgi:hypothetical protein